MAVEQVPSRYAVPLSVLDAGARVPLAEQVSSQAVSQPLSGGTDDPWADGALDGDGD